MPAYHLNPSLRARRWIFIGFLVVLHLIFLFGPDSQFGRLLFLVHIGIGLLWQPFIQPRRQFGLFGSAMVVAVTGLLAYFLGWGVLVIWTMLLSGVVGGKVFLFPDRWERPFHLIGLGYLTATTFALLLPRYLAAFGLAEPILGELVLYLVPLTFLAMAALPVGASKSFDRIEIVDYVYGVLVFLLQAVIALGSISFALMFKVTYLESLLVALALVSALLLLLGLIWDPRSGFGGLGSAVAQHVTSLGLPIEDWLESLAELSKREKAPEHFLDLACAELPERLPGVVGGQWSALAGQGSFGEKGKYRSRFAYGYMMLELETRTQPSPTLRWHYDLAARLLAEYYLGKWRAQELRRLSYIEAIHETGARLTHDVKNLLQTLDTLCMASTQEGATPSASFNALMRRQLPEISTRLRQTLGKLAAPGRVEPALPMSAALWLATLENCYGSSGVRFVAKGDLAGVEIADSAMFSSIAENLLQNFVAKRRIQTDIVAEVRFMVADGWPLLEVCDDGTAVPDDLAAQLFSQRVSSENGLGVGLYQCARLAAAAGYRLVLRENRAGCVCFRLTPESS
jgi:signal transduction histidine kinase